MGGDAGSREDGFWFVIGEGQVECFGVAWALEVVGAAYVKLNFIVVTLRRQEIKAIDRTTPRPRSCQRNVFHGTGAAVFHGYSHSDVLHAHPFFLYVVGIFSVEREDVPGDLSWNQFQWPRRRGIVMMCSCTCLYGCYAMRMGQSPYIRKESVLGLIVSDGGCVVRARAGDSADDEDVSVGERRCRMLFSSLWPFVVVSGLQ
mmetsp:Transcript_31063/g.64581  ORF Transcript_31063/g.64581 Transcript_31063/m.64581 type:complete len:202 (-) Transcript_31063:919-1524(-)